MCRSRRELLKAYLLAKIGCDTAENEPSKVTDRAPRGHQHAGAADDARVALLRREVKVAFELVASLVQVSCLKIGNSAKTRSEEKTKC